MSNDKEILIKHLKSLDSMLIDESHRLRNFKGMRAKHTPAMPKAVMQVSKIAKGRYALTGTLAPNYAWNAFGTLHFLFPDLFKSYYDFMNYYFKFNIEVIYKGGRAQQISTPIGFKNPEMKQELAEFLEMVSVQRKRKDVMKWIPDIDVETIKLDMTSKQQKMYDQFILHMEYKDYICEGIMDTTVRLNQVSLSPQLLGETDKGCKYTFLEQYIKDYQDIPIMIVSMSTSFLEILANQFNAPLLRGSTSDVQRKKIEQDFQSGKFNLLLANIDVVKEGFTLSRGERLIFVDRSYVYTDNLQTESRIVPTTKEEAIAKNDSKVLILEAQGSYDHEKNRLLEAKENSVTIMNNYVAFINQKRSDNN